MIHVTVAIDRLEKPLLDDGCQTHAVNDASMVQFIADDDVTWFTQSPEDCFAGGPA